MDLHGARGSVTKAAGLGRGALYGSQETLPMADPGAKTLASRRGTMADALRRPSVENEADSAGTGNE